MKQNSLQAWILAARPKTLSGAAVPVMIGLSLAYSNCSIINTVTFEWVAAICCMLFAFLMQIDANLINDYYDCKRGTDDNATRLGPERACAQGWITMKAMMMGIIIVSCIACAVGSVLILYGGWEMIAIGVACVVFAFLYTTYFSYIGLGDLLVLVFFGIVPVCASYFIQTHDISIEVLLSSVACGLVIDNLLIINNFRDRETDMVAGKKTLVVRFGEDIGLRLYLYLGLIAYMVGIVFVLNGHLWAFTLSVVYLLLHVNTYRKIKQINKGKELNRCLGETARNIFIYGLCIAIGSLL